MSEFDHDESGHDASRRKALGCLAAWTGAAVLWNVAGGVPRALGMTSNGTLQTAPANSLTFVQISDTHIGFNKPANPDVVGSLRRAIADINALPQRPAFVVHTGDISHLSRADQFGQAREIFKEIRVDRLHTVPGEHDAIDDGVNGYLKFFGTDGRGRAWYSYNQGGVHFIGLVNVLNLKAGGLGSLGDEQLEWLEDDVRHLKASTPIVVFAHIPLWTIYPQWGWGTDDSARALSYLKRFGSVSVLNGHIHQIMQKVEGNVTFHTAYSTAFPQPAPGTADGPGPMKVPAEQLRSVLGVSDVNFVRKHHSLAVTDSTLA